MKFENEKSDKNRNWVSGNIACLCLNAHIRNFFGTFVLEILWPGRPKGPSAYMQIGPIWTTDPYALLLGFLIALYSGGQTFRWVVWPPKKKKEKSNAIHIPLDGGSLDDPGQSTQK